MKPTIAILAALALAGCASLTDAGRITAKSVEFYGALKANGVTIDGKVTREEAPGYLAAVAQVFGDRIPDELMPAVRDVCALSDGIETDLDAEAAAVCAQVAS